VRLSTTTVLNGLVVSSFLSFFSIPPLFLSTCVVAQRGPYFPSSQLSGHIWDVCDGRSRFDLYYALRYVVQQPHAEKQTQETV
jgi:hypothetical protein